MRKKENFILIAILICLFFLGAYLFVEKSVAENIPSLVNYEPIKIEKQKMLLKD